MKEIKLKGTPLKIKQRKSLIKFEPEDVDVVEFIGSPIWTQSGNRGHVNEAAKRDGIAKCTFKRKMRMSDIVFMRVLHEVEAARFFNSLPAPLKPHEMGRLRLEQRRGVEIMDVNICPIFGTTVSLVRNEAGTYIATDGCEFKYLNPRAARILRRSGIPQKPSTEERDKIYEISDNIFAVPSGCGGWFNKIIYRMSNKDDLRIYRKAIGKGDGIPLTAKECADYAKHLFEMPYEKLPSDMKQGPVGFDLSHYKKAWLRQLKC